MAGYLLLVFPAPTSEAAAELPTRISRMSLKLHPSFLYAMQ